jgi:6-phosphogluconate dehydrogenase (decarboxylating)
MTMPVGMIGLGRVGGNMVRRLMRGGHPCVVHDRTQDPVRALAREGATGAKSLDDFVARLEPLELAHLSCAKGRTYEDCVGVRGLERLGTKKWRRRVQDVVERLAMALEADDVVIGGGNAKRLKRLPDGACLGSNRNAFLGGFRLWDEPWAQLDGAGRRVRAKR